MAKVGHIERSIFGKYFKIPVKCSSKGIFSVDLPKELQGISKFENAYKTRSELDDALTKLIETIEKEQTTFTDSIFYKFNSTEGTRDGRVTGTIEFDYIAIRTYKTGIRHNYFKIHRKTQEEIDKLGDYSRQYEVGEILYTLGNMIYYIKPQQDYYSSPGYQRKMIDFSVDGVEMFESLKSGMSKLGEKVSVFLDNVQETGKVLPGKNLNMLGSGFIG